MPSASVPMTPPQADPRGTVAPARRRWKIHRRLAPVAFAFYMAAIMAFLMCAVIVASSRGFGPGYIAGVLRAYTLAMPVAFGCVMLVRPVVVRLVAWTVHP